MVPALLSNGADIVIASPEVLTLTYEGLAVELEVTTALDVAIVVTVDARLLLRIMVWL